MLGSSPAETPASLLPELYLSSIGKVSKLSLPQHQAVRVLHAVPKLEAQDAKLGQTAVADGELVGLLALKDVSQRKVPFARLLVVHDRMPVTEGASLYVLATHAHMVACMPTPLSHVLS